MSYTDRFNVTSDAFSGYDRLRVDPGQTSFWEGREFRAFYEFSIPLAGHVLLKLETPIDFIVQDINFEVDTGGLRADLILGATDVGPWTPLAVVPTNVMSDPNRRFPYYVGQITTFTGAAGAFTGGTIVDTVRVRSSSQSVAAQNVSQAQDSPRGRPPGSYFIDLTSLDGVNDTTRGIFAIRWEERAKHPSWRAFDGVD